MPPLFSKPLAYNLTQFLFKSRKRQVISSSILAIVLLLIKLRLTKGSTDNLKVKPKKNKKGRGNVDFVFFQRITSLLKIVIPSIKSAEILDLVLLTVFLVFRTFLSIYIASVNGRIVKAIIDLKLSDFIKRIINLGMIAIPSSFVNSYLDFLNKSLAIRFRERLTHYFHDRYLKDMVYY
jgi:ATP-binding cassette subfamily D (ALD) protein 3